MNSGIILGQIQDILRDIFDQQDLQISMATHAGDIPEWDSLRHINIVVAIEKTFQTEFTLAELQELKNVGDMVELIIRKKNS